VNRLADAAVHEPIGFNIARTDQRPVSIVLAKLPPHTETPGTSDKSQIAVFLYDPDFIHHTSALLVRELFQLTPVESSIAILMMESFGNESGRQLYG
jgi:hypothetical protein